METLKPSLTYKKQSGYTPCGIHLAKEVITLQVYLWKMVALNRWLKEGLLGTVWHMNHCSGKMGTQTRDILNYGLELMFLLFSLLLFDMCNYS